MGYAPIKVQFLKSALFSGFIEKMYPALTFEIALALFFFCTMGYASVKSETGRQILKAITSEIIIYIEN
jgi:TRAP-type mannitol/chloroaromatic compound transport system permease large subunit